MLARAGLLIVFSCVVCVLNNPLSAQQQSPAAEIHASATDESSMTAQQIQMRFQQLEAELQQLRSERAVISSGYYEMHGRQTPLKQLSGEQCVAENCTESAGFYLRNQNDEFPTVQISGFIQVDAARFNQSATSINTVGDADDGADFRRARLLAKGHVADNVSYLVEFDFAFPGRPSFMDVWMEIEDLPLLGNLRIGQWRQPFGMDELTSVKELTFLERGLPFALAPFRQIGIGIHDSYEQTGTTWAVSAFRYPTDPFGGNIGDAGGVSLASRITTLLYEDEATKSLIHFGADYAFIDPSTDSSRFRNTPEVFGSFQPGATNPSNPIPFFADTNVIPTNNFQLVNLESGFRKGSLSGQAEWRFAHVEQVGGSSPNFQSAYAQLSYILTGEVRPYNKKGGVFGRIVPNKPFKPGCGTGAWETAAKLSWLDLDDANIAGNRLTNATLGLNWYLNKRTKFQFNYIYSLLDGTAIPRSNTNIVAMRAQIDF